MSCWAHGRLLSLPFAFHGPSRQHGADWGRRHCLPATGSKGLTRVQTPNLTGQGGAAGLPSYVTQGTMTPFSGRAAQVTLPPHVQGSTSSPAQRGAKRGVPKGGEFLAKGTAMCPHRTGTDLLHLSFLSSPGAPGSQGPSPVTPGAPPPTLHVAQSQHPNMLMQVKAKQMPKQGLRLLCSELQGAGHIALSPGPSEDLFSQGLLALCHAVFTQVDYHASSRSPRQGSAAPGLS